MTTQRIEIDGDAAARPHLVHAAAAPVIKNVNLNAARAAKKDEFYTQLSDIENELRHYAPHFAGKTVYLNCDDPRESNFFRYFALNFEHLRLKRLIATSYAGGINGEAVYYDYEGDKNGNGVIDPDEIDVKPMMGDGDFRSDESIGLLKEADIVVTNPPFSLFKEYVEQLVEHDKKFLVVGNQNAITYKDIFPLIRDGEMWLGAGFRGNVAHFASPYEDTASASDHREGMVRVSGVQWFTNMDYSKRHEDLILYKTYDASEHPTYDNYDAIDVHKTSNIPVDYDGVMGVPITFLNKWNPDQFEILGSNRGRGQDLTGVYGRSTYVSGKETFKRIFIQRKARA